MGLGHGLCDMDYASDIVSLLEASAVGDSAVATRVDENDRCGT